MMFKRTLTTACAALLCLTGTSTPSVQARAGQTPVAPSLIVESSTEVRFQLDLHVPDSALAVFLPNGWVPNIAAQGAAKDANLRLIFIDRLTITGPSGRPLGVGSNRLVYLVAPTKDPNGVNSQLVIGGLTAEPTDAPGPFGVYKLATTHTMKRTTTDTGSGATLDSQDWIFEAASDEHIEMHITFERGLGNKSNPSDVKFFSAKDPTVFQVSRQEQVLEILRNVTTTPTDRVKSFSLKASGGHYAKLFDGTERVLSWDNIPWIIRSVLAPPA